MRNTDNTMRAEAIMLAMKAIDIISKTLDIIVGDDKPAVNEKDSTAAAPKRRKDECLKRPGEDTYRADAIRFNEQFLRDRYELRYNTMKKTTEFRPRRSEERTNGRGLDEWTGF